MPCIDISNLLKIVDGVLYVLDSCCTWVAVGDIAGVPPPLGDTPLDPHDTGTVGYSACGKAAAIVGAIYTVLRATYESFGDWDYPWQILPNIEKAVGYNLNDKWLPALILDWLAFGAYINPDDVFSDYDRQLSICNLKNFFGDDALGIPDEETYTAVKSCLHTFGFLYDGLIMTAVACLGRANLDNIAKLGAGDLDVDCGCPDQPFDQVVNTDGLDWYYIVDLRSSGLPANATFESQHNCPTPYDEYVPGKGLGCCPGGTGRAQIAVYIPVLNTAELTDSHVTRWGIRWTTHEGDAYRPSPGDQTFGFNNGGIGIGVGTVDDFLISRGGRFDFKANVPPDNVAGAVTFKWHMDWDPLVAGFVENDPTTGNFIEWFFVGGTGQKPELGFP